MIFRAARGAAETEPREALFCTEHSTVLGALHTDRCTLGRCRLCGRAVLDWSPTFPPGGVGDPLVYPRPVHARTLLVLRYTRRAAASGVSVSQV